MTRENIFLTLNIFILVINIIIGTKIWMSNHNPDTYFAKHTVRVGDLREDVTIAGGYKGQGALTLYDHRTDKGYVEMGFYQHGAGIFTPHRLELWAGKEVSIANLTRQPAFQVRNHDDTQSAIWLNGAGFIGTGLDQIGISFQGLNCQNKEQCSPVAMFHKDGSLAVNDLILDGQSLRGLLNE